MSKERSWSAVKLFSRRKPDETALEMRPVNARACKVIAVVNQKGGAGKTPWTMIYARLFASDARLQDLYGRRPRVAVIDLDPKHALTGYFGYYGEKFETVRYSGIDQVLHHPDVDGKQPAPTKSVVQVIPGIDDIHLYPANDDLQSYENRMIWMIEELKNHPAVDWTDEQRTEYEKKKVLLHRYERLLKGFVDSIRDNYDRIVIDFKPGETPLGTAGLLATDWVHIPSKLTLADVEQARDEMLLVDAFAKDQVPGLKVMAVIPMDVDPRSGQEQHWFDQINRRPTDPNIPDMSKLVVTPLMSDKQFKMIIEMSGSPAYRRSVQRIAGEAFTQIMQNEGLI